MKTLIHLLCAALLALAAPAWASVGRDEAAAVAQGTNGGRVLSVEKSESGGHAVWRVKLVTPQGEVRVILVDVATGRRL
ncbi:PepSY domain-containing protein [Caenimonas terrae]|uniref:PepSY domain-containing protein n=1 Tax=Caenimonas terrae TaxID=696074 RepID=A0ABW0NBP7_9BURK